MQATHNFGTAPTRATTGADTFKAALYLASATLNSTTTSYSTVGEVTGAGYTAGGVTVTNANPPVASGTNVGTGNIAYWTPSASFSWFALTTSGSIDTVLIYNSTQGTKAVSVHTFSAQNITNGTFTLTMPTNNNANALIRLST
jgi:hypothetical protein